MAARVDVMRHARDLVAGGWTQGAAARNAAGLQVPPGARDACRFCAVGAIRRASRLARGNPGVDLDLMLAQAVGVGTESCVVRWNDEPGRKQAEVVAAFDRAIEAMTKEFA